MNHFSEFDIFSAFDGASCGQVALNRAQILFSNYFASEIKKHAIKVTQHNFPNTIQVGDINNINGKDARFKNVRLLQGGSPCQDISNLKPGNSIYDEKSRLFFQYLKLKEQIDPEFFLLENVVGDKDSINIITDLLGIDPIRINSSLISFQKRDRYYWTNIPGVTVPKDLGISFQDFKETDEEVLKQYKVNRTPSREIMWRGKCPNVTYRDKINCITCKQDRWSNAGLLEHEDFCRYLTKKELELGQTLPLGYTDILSYNQASDVIGDGWTVDVIAHIYSFLKPLI